MGSVLSLKTAILTGFVFLASCAPQIDFEPQTIFEDEHLEVSKQTVLQKDYSDVVFERVKIARPILQFRPNAEEISEADLFDRPFLFKNPNKFRYSSWVGINVSFFTKENQLFDFWHQFDGNDYLARNNRNTFGSIRKFVDKTKVGSFSVYSLPSNLNRAHYLPSIASEQRQKLIEICEKTKNTPKMEERLATFAIFAAAIDGEPLESRETWFDPLDDTIDFNSLQYKLSCSEYVDSHIYTYIISVSGRNYQVIRSTAKGLNGIAYANDRKFHSTQVLPFEGEELGELLWKSE